MKESRLQKELKEKFIEIFFIVFSLKFRFQKRHFTNNDDDDWPYIWWTGIIFISFHLSLIKSNQEKHQNYQQQKKKNCCIDKKHEFFSIEYH